MDELARLYSRGREHRGRFLLGAGLALVAALFDGILLKVLKELLELLGTVPQLQAEGRLVSATVLFVCAVPLLAALKGSVVYAEKYLIAHSALSVLADLRADLYRALVERPMSYLARYPPAEFASRVTNDVQRIEVGLTLRTPELLREAPSAVIVAVYLWVLNPKLALIVTVILPLAGFLVRGWARKIKSASRLAQEHTASLGTVLNESLGGIRIVKAFLGERREIERFAGYNDSFRRTSLRAYRTQASTGPILETLGSLLIVVLIAVAVWEISRGTLQAPDFVTFFTGMIMMYKSVKKTTGAYTELQNTTAAAQRCFDLLDDHAPEPTGRVEVGPLADAIACRGVDFSYGESPALRGFEMTLARGEVVALVGESGSGKTTVTSLLARFHDVTAGSITWDGVDLREISPSSLRRQIALVTQDTVVFDDTVERNIAYGEGEPDRARVEAAARAAHAHDFVMELEHGYATRLGPGGGRLSGGQRQRIAIARAVYKDAPLLVLDEATSALDSHSEALVQEALRKLMANRTVLVVAHRLSTIREADRILVMSEGRVVQEGSHDDLVEQDGTYRQFYRLQSHPA